LKEDLQRRANTEHRTLSQEVTMILERAVYGAKPPAQLERRGTESRPRRRADDPSERRRRDDLPVSLEEAAVAGD
jgi:hypothetical protein